MDEYPSAQNKSDLISFKNIQQNQYDAIYLVGDTLSDGLAAQTYAIPFIYASYGYGGLQDWSGITIFKRISGFEQILDF